MAMLMDHIVLNVEDEEEMMSFYSRVLGLAPERFDAFREGKVPFPSIRINTDTIIDLFPKSLWNGGPQGIRGRTNLNHFCLNVDKEEWDRLRERLETEGVALEEGPVKRWGAHGTGISIYFRDPEGNLIEARYYEKGEPVLVE
jgi:catechol 2,3-dioxygenase-like lactoylglutathione lyase family enzyme